MNFQIKDKKMNMLQIAKTAFPDREIVEKPNHAVKIGCIYMYLKSGMDSHEIRLTATLNHENINRRIKFQDEDAVTKLQDKVSKLESEMVELEKKQKEKETLQKEVAIKNRENKETLKNVKAELGFHEWSEELKFDSTGWEVQFKKLTEDQLRQLVALRKSFV